MPQTKQQSPLQMSPAGLALLKQFEGFRRHAYLDLAGFATIGYGHRVLPGEAFPSGLSAAQAEELLASDVHAAGLAVLRLVSSTLSQGQFDALVDFTFNLGAQKLAGSTLLAKLNAGDYDSAAEQLLRWDHVGAVEVSGLKARRKAEFGLWQGAEGIAAAAA